MKAPKHAHSQVLKDFSLLCHAPLDIALELAELAKLVLHRVLEHRGCDLRPAGDASRLACNARANVVRVRELLRAADSVCTLALHVIQRLE
jgi:hypothetical protein